MPTSRHTQQGRMSEGHVACIPMHTAAGHGRANAERQRTAGIYTTSSATSFDSSRLLSVGAIGALPRPRGLRADRLKRGRTMDLGIRDRKALVCASSTGLGLACATALAREGCRVFINGRSEERLVRRRSRSARPLESTAVAIVADLNTAAGRERLVAGVPARRISW